MEQNLKSLNKLKYVRKTGIKHGSIVNHWEEKKPSLNGMVFHLELTSYMEIIK